VYKKITTAFLLVILFSTISFASGFQINEHGARAMGMAGAFAGLADDPSALYFNPAGITQLKGTHILAGVTFISPSSTFRGPSPAIDEYSMKKQLFTPINLYVTHQLSDDWYVGLGVNNQFGLGTLWDDNWIGRDVAVNTEIRTFYFTPVVAYKINDQLSVSAGPVFAWGDVTIERYTSLYPFSGEAKVSLKGNGTAWGFTAGLLYRPLHELQLGLSFRSPTKFKFTGDASSQGPASFASRLPAGNISAEVTMPMDITLGAAYFPSKNLTITADFQYVGWSSYDKLAVDFENAAIPDVSAPRNYVDSYIARLGGEYKVTGDLTVRGGLIYDHNPVKDEYVDPILPDADRLGFNIGVGYKILPNVNVDLAYFFLRFTERKITTSQIYYTPGNAAFNGVYNSYAHLFGVNFSYNF